VELPPPSSPLSDLSAPATTDTTTTPAALGADLGAASNGQSKQAAWTKPDNTITVLPTPAQPSQQGAAAAAAAVSQLHRHG